MLSFAALIDSGYSFGTGKNADYIKRMNKLDKIRGERQLIAGMALGPPNDYDLAFI